MITNLTLINLKAGSHAHPTKGDVFVLKTCQRTLVVGLGEAPFLHLRQHALREDIITDIFEGHDAYVFLLETICGLRSEVLAEYEVVSQFKDAYNEFCKEPNRNTAVLGVLEKLFQDNKKIRTNYLTEIGQLTYAGIARKIIHTSVNDGDVLILGSGTLAEDLVKLLKKKHRVFISARNHERVSELINNYALEAISWDALDTYAKFPFIVNTIGTDTTIFNENFFRSFFEETAPEQMKLFIDLGSPSVIDTTLTEKDGVLRLEDIFKQSAKLNIEKLDKVNRAKAAILEIAKRRCTIDPVSTPFDWEEFNFAYSL